MFSIILEIHPCIKISPIFYGIISGYVGYDGYVVGGWWTVWYHGGMAGTYDTQTSLRLNYEIIPLNISLTPHSKQNDSTTSTIEY